MQVTDETSEIQRLKKFATAIKKIITDNNLELATKRLGYFAEDFAIDKRRKYETVDFQRRYAEIKTNKRKRLYSEEQVSQSLSSLTFDVLEFLDSIVVEYNDFQLSEFQKILPSEENISPKQENDNDTDKKITDISQTKNNVKKTKLERLKDDWRKKRQVNINEPVDTDIVVYASNITKEYSRKVNDFQLTLPELELKLGEITSLVGENGNGKTTLLRIIIGELAQSSAILKYPALVNPKKHNWYKIKQQIAYIPQSLPAWNGLLVDNLHFTAAINGIKGKENEDEVNFILWRLGLYEYRNATWNQISAGFKMRFALAKSLVWKPKLLVLDEPLANLDVNTQQLFLQDLRDLADSLAYPKAIILSSQHLYEVENITDNIVFLKQGSVLYNGKLADFGEDREANAFELSCSLSKYELMDLLEEKISCTEVDIIGHNQYIVNTSIDITANDIMKLFIDYNISLNYFRDISKSTRRLFKTEK